MPKKQRQWLARSQAEIAEFFGVHPDTVKAWRKKRMPGKARHYPLDKIAQWLRRKIWSTPGSTVGRVDTKGDPLLAGSDSPALEDYRRERARLARLDRLERTKVLLPRELVHQGFGELAKVLRDAGETLQRQFGPEAHLILEEAFDDAERLFVDLFGDYDSDELDESYG